MYRRNAVIFTCLLLSLGCSTKPRPAVSIPRVTDEREAVQEDVQLLNSADGHFDDWVLMFGNLHAHSHLSDDIRPFDPLFSPARAFEYARSNGLDFLAVSDHHKAVDAPHRLSLNEEEFRDRLLKVADSINQTNQDFVAIPALEWGNTSTGNHINLIGPNELPPDSIRNDDYDELFGWAAEHVDFLQLNHPNSWKGKSNRNREIGNFAENLYPSTEDYVTALDPAAATISIITTVRGGHISGEDRHSEEKVHRDMQWENYYKTYLNKGFHLAPSANQDTHWRNWGTVTAARTAAWSTGASYNELVEAFKSNRVYATEDDELAVVYQVQYKDRVYWMGETVTLEEPESEIELLIKIWQVAGSDGDPTDEGPYTIDIVSDWDGVGGRQAAIWETVEDIPEGELVSIPLVVVDLEYVYLRITEQNGQDNPLGQGEDVFVNGTDERQADGKRDDLDDQAWTAPIWFELSVIETEEDMLEAVPAVPDVGVSEEPTKVFVWSELSSFYHDPDCWVVERIGRGQLRRGPLPEGRVKHKCQEAGLNRWEYHLSP